MKRILKYNVLYDVVLVDEKLNVSECKLECYREVLEKKGLKICVAKI